MKLPLPVFALFFILTSVSCGDGDTFLDSDDRPDLAFNSQQLIYNYCTGQTELIKLENLYWITNGLSWIQLYWDENYNVFRDCLGNPWVVYPPVAMYSQRYFSNRKPLFGKVKPARTPKARSYTRVTGNGGVSEYEGPIVEFPDMEGGIDNMLNHEIQITAFGTYEMDHYLDPVEEIDEREESNNDWGETFTRSPGEERAKDWFVIKPFTPEELAQFVNGYYLFKGGKATFIRK